MFKQILLIASLSMLAFVCCRNSVSARTDNPEIKELLAMQADAWNKGDLDTFMTGYSRSDETSYTSGGKVVWGYDALKERYEKRYGNSKESMGKLSFSDLKIVDLEKNHALCIGHWHLEGGENKIYDGVFSLILRHQKEGWKVIHDHTSLMQDNK